MSEPVTKRQRHDSIEEPRLELCITSKHMKDQIFDYPRLFNKSHHRANNRHATKLELQIAIKNATELLLRNTNFPKTWTLGTPHGTWEWYFKFIDTNQNKDLWLSRALMKTEPKDYDIIQLIKMTWRDKTIDQTTEQKKYPYYKIVLKKHDTDDYILRGFERNNDGSVFHKKSHGNTDELDKLESYEDGCYIDHSTLDAPVCFWINPYKQL
jgi:hypothetical protein